MTHVRTFKIDSESIGIQQKTFCIDNIPFREELARMINFFEEELGLSHKTCQCLPVFYEMRTCVSGTAFHTINFECGICREVHVILTF